MTFRRTPGSGNRPEPGGARLSRRSLVGLSAASLTGVATGAAFHRLTGVAQDATPEANPHAAHGTPVTHGTPAATPSVPFEGITGQPLVEPEVRESSGGVLETQLGASLTTTTVAGREVISTVYEGSFPGPTLAMWPGDTLRIRLVNSLDEGTNLHTHGFHVSPKDNGDNIFLHIEPGEVFDYEYQIPNDHFAGLYWYHPHYHGNTAKQNTAGMNGAIIVRGGLDELEGIAGLTEHLLVMTTTQFDGNGQMVPVEQQSPASRMRLINGQLQPVISARPGETQRWRIANNSSDDFFLLHLADHKLHMIAKDGGPFDEVVTVDQILLAPAERVEVLVQMSTTPGSYQLRSLEWGEDYQVQPDVLMATVSVEGEAVETPPLPASLIPFEDLSQLPIDNRRVTVFEEPGPPLFLAIDGKHFDPDRIDQTVTLGALEEWVIRNTSSHRHPFHIHVNDFQIVAIDGEPVRAHGWQDTVNLPPNSEITVRMRFMDFDGKFVYHCHILSHEDFGMMATVEVVP
jgi:FtsP/CotA-like multicopper oxidase with cupredoxin domain